MAAKPKPDLNALLSDAGGSTRKRPAPVEAVPASHAERPAKATPQPGRVGTVPVTAHFPEDVRAQIKILAVEQRRTMQGMIAEAFNDLFSKYGKPEIVPLDDAASR